MPHHNVIIDFNVQWVKFFDNASRRLNCLRHSERAPAILRPAVEVFERYWGIDMFP
jgi:hypothetical protein